MNFKERLFLLGQYLLPHHTLSRLIGLAAECRADWFKNPLISWFVRRYQVDMSEAEIGNPHAYEHFNAFFTRALRDGTRPLDATPGAILSPADGAISQLGPIEHGRIFQAKGHSFSVLELLGGDAEMAAPFMGGQFATVYLSPRDYHRVHMPLAGTLREMVYVPGRLFSVNGFTAGRCDDRRQHRDGMGRPGHPAQAGAQALPLRHRGAGTDPAGQGCRTGPLQARLHRHRAVRPGAGALGRRPRRRQPAAHGPATGPAPRLSRCADLRQRQPAAGQRPGGVFG
jgi:hypothetical protein